ncbi:hypothetical protein FOH10_02620 [Nocardia otitidiscaviarum]|uniref:Methionine synthase n=1 Tax=Nocardia otitidiscaviarum TaxID=1823 RepID=A0A516NFX0_9NOCA|nr:hypothetical protein [Nocardia otitidiscaviarum]MCP9623151.1 hypothetical protein [Nocardia otitidiscaviarum]QDP77806.1 hypothetical protein FOH10_02620 [Nocardia otitidiscaviarum]
MGTRAVHFVGSFPAESTDDAMRAMLDGAGPLLRTLPTGEVRRYEFYIQPIIEDLVTQGALEVKRPGSWRTSGERTVHRIPRGAELTGDMMDLGYTAEAKEALPIFHALRAERALPELRLQIGMPTDFTLAFIALGPAGIRAHRQAFHDATVREIAAVHALAGEDVVFQLEATAELVLLARTQPLHRRVEAALRLGRHIAAVAAAAPAGIRIGVHVCLGSMNNKARVVPRDAAPLVALANSIARQWPSDRTLEFIHGPLAAGDIPPSTRARFYAPLGDLQLPPGTRFYAGLVHETPSMATQIATLELVEQALGRPVDGVASACGLGRRPRSIADAMAVRAADMAAAL